MPRLWVLVPLLFFYSDVNAQKQPIVTGISPSSGSRNGGVRLTVFGVDFADNFDLNNDPNVGTYTKLVAGSEYSCDLHVDGVTNVTATCYTRAMPEGEYQVKVTVDGVEVSDYCTRQPSDCVYTVTDSVTPKINTLTPRSGVPGTLLTSEARMFTSRYGSNEESQNARTEKIVKFWAAGKICNVKDLDTDQYYGLNLYNDSNGVAGDDGYFKCKPDNDYIGNYNLSFIVEGQYGRSLPDPSLLHVHTNGIGMYQMYTEVEGLSANTGSTEGGLMLTVNGQYFDDTDSPARVLVDGKDCYVQTPISATSIVCETPAVPAAAPAIYTGNRGLTLTVLNGTSDYTTANWATGTDTRIDETYYQTVNYSDHVTRMAGAFVAPETGTFRFYLKTRSNSKMTLTDPSTGTELVSVTSSSWSGRGAESASVSLAKDTDYQLTVLSGSTGDSEVELTARHYETRYIISQTGAAKAEIQDLVFDSFVQAEVQRLEVTSGGPVTGTQEVQTLTVTGDLSSPIIVGFNDVFTEPLTADTVDNNMMAQALNALPSLQGHSVTVTDQQDASSRSYTVTFPATLGNVAELQVEAANQNSQAVGSVSTITEGLSSLEFFTLDFGGTLTSPIPVSATTTQVKEALEESAGVRCHQKLTSGKTLMDCETAASCAGQRIGHEEPFCGRYSAKNPGTLYWKGQDDQGFFLDTSSSTLCLGHKGPVTRVWVRFLYKDSNSETQSDTISFAITVPTNKMEKWRYICEDIYSLVKSKQPGKTGYQLQGVGVLRDSSSIYDVYIDHIVLNREETVSDLSKGPKMRMPQARPNGAFIRGLTVTGSTGDYIVEIDPYLCGHNFPLISVPSSSVSGSTAASSNSATFQLSSDGQQLTMKNARQTKASKPIGGSFTVTFNGHTSQAITVSPDLELDVVRDKLSLIQGLGDVDLTYTGDCTAFTYTVTMATKAGDQPEMSIDDSSLTGNSVTTSVTTKQDGSLWYTPIPGDMLHTVHSDPQVTVYINDVPASCASGVDCSFTWSNADTPTITDITPTTGGQGTVVTITGNGFDVSNNEVRVGGAACTVSSSTSTSLVCTMSVGPNGPQPVRVRVPSKGLASATLAFTFTSSISSISPTSGSLEGGIQLTVQGQGFASDATVTVGGAACNITSITVLEILCTLPAEPTGSSGAVSVVVSQGSTTLTSPTDFTYSAAETPVVSAISVSSVSAWGGQALVIDGSGFGTNTPNVTVNGEQLVVTSNDDVRIEAVFPPLAPGSYPLRVQVDGKGLADIRTNAIPDIVVTLKVTGLTPTRGSLYGGTLLTMTGEGFGSNTSLVEVSVGSHVCTVDVLSDTELTCRVDYTGTTHTVSNQGTHKDYGTGYAYDPKQLSIKEGDCVRWVWTTPSFVSGIAYGIFQTATDTDKVSMMGGFASPGASSANGQYQFCFNLPGDYFYWSGYVNAPYNTIYLRGQVTVTSRVSSVEDLHVRVGGVEAEHDTVTGSSPSSYGSCSGDVSLVPGCTPSVNPMTTDVSKFQFALHECATPYITALSASNGTTLDTITLDGSGFGSTDCQNEIVYADVAEGVVTSSSGSQLSFTVSELGPPPVGLMEQFTLRVGNRGNALVALANDGDRRFALLPVYNDMSPYKGSVAGGTLVTITGSGFAPSPSDVVVTMDGYNCVVQMATSTQVICLTPSSMSSKMAVVDVVTYHNGNPFPVECRGNFCSFIYDSSVTATVNSVTPTSIIAASTPITIAGSGFGTTLADVSVTLGGATCSVTSVTDTEVLCNSGDVPAGSHIPKVTISGQGLATADSSHAVDSQALVSSLSPTQGSVHGGTHLTLNGHGFKAPSTLTVDGQVCNITSESATILQCVTPAHVAGAVSVAVTSNGVTFPVTTFTYSSAATLVVSSVNPTTGQAGDSVVVSGSGFSAAPSDNNVLIGDVAATVTTATSTSLTITLGNQITGTFPVVVDVSGFGLSNNDVTFEYTLGNVNINPTTGTTAGGQTLTISGSGFLPGSTDVTVCGMACEAVTGSTTATQLLCLTPPNAVVMATTCAVEVTVNSVTKTAGSQYTYDPSITPEITDVTPPRGGTAGGTLLTITGTGFRTSKPVVSVMVGGSTCDVQTVIDTQITCTTNSATSGNYQVDVNINGTGSALQTSADFQFIDVWSSPFTWGGNPPPVAGDLVVVPPGQILLLDNSTERLSMLLIQGTLIFDEKDLELHSDNILISNGGALQVGTESKPFPQQYTAIIKLHGHLRSRELPIYGTKVLAVREGSLDLHGHPTPVTWTQLSTTAPASSMQLSLTTPVNWQVGDEIVLPSTSHRHTQVQNEVHVITAVSVDGLTLTLSDPLAYDHVVAEHTFQDSSTVTLRGEVGLLSHNVKVMGSVNDEWTEDIPACPAGFDTGEFSTQTCFQGRFGAETGSDQFGAHIIAHAPEPDTQAAVIRLSYVEITHAGQAFRLGRYPVHLHLNGDMTGSYVRGLGIHNSFNRAVNVHGTQNALIEHVVLYNIMGGAFFLEDGIETNNTFQYNLGVFVRPSSSLRNDDITPATFWVTNPDNIIIHNHAAGGSHFGFWYRMKNHPEGPSFDSSICPKHVPLSRFENNTAHSFGWFGLWIFEDMFPHQGGSCDSSSPTEVSIFKTLTAWNCEKGAEAVNSGALQFKDFVLVNNEKAGYEGKLLVNVPQYDEVNGPMVDGGKIIAHLGNKLDQEGNRQCTKAGIVLPYQNGLIIRNVQFYNFDRAGCAAFEFTRITGTCSIYCGGFTYITKGLQWENTNNKVHFEWESEGVLKDEDGTLTGNAGYSVIPTTPTLPPTKCTANVAEMSVTGVPGSVCDDTVKLHRFAFTGIMPSSLEFKNVLFTNQHGTSNSPYAIKRITHKPGWVFVMVDGECYEMEFENAGHISNVSYDGAYYQFDVGDTLCVTQKVEKPDRVFMDGSTHINMSDHFPSPASAQHGDWYYADATGKLSYYIKRTSKRRKRGAILYGNDLKVDFRAFRCFYDNCIPPPDPVTVSVTPGNAIPWSSLSSWDFRNGSKPVQGDSITIPADKWLIINEPIPPLDYLIIEGGLSAAEDASLDFTLDVNYIIVVGRLAIGWEHAPFNGTARIILRGEHSTPSYPTSNGAELGAKFLAVYGGLDLHGTKPDVKWTRLASTAMPGDTTLTLQDPVTWSVGDEVMVTTTDASAWHTETFQLTSVAGTVLTLNSSLQYRHVAHTETLGTTLKLTSRVALLTRNIVIEGGSYPDMVKESFGARVIVAKTVYDGVSRNGFAKVENTEFYHTGQEGYTEPYDPRYSLAFVDVLNDNTTDFYSYVRDNSFHNGFSPAVGVFAVDNLEVSGNVIHHTVYYAIHTNSIGTRVEGNLMALNIWSGAYLDRREEFNFHYDASLEAVEASDLVLKDNVIAGCERVGYHVPGQDCATATADLWTNNEAHSCLTGVAIFPADVPASATCTVWSGYLVWKNADYGLYVNNGPSIEIKDILAAENGVSVMTYAAGPAALSHAMEDKTITIMNSTFVGRTSSHDCSLDSLDSSDDNVQLSSQSRTWRHGSCGMTGVAFPNFVSAGNRAPEKPWAGTMAYQAIKGVMQMSNVVFEHFTSDGAGSHDVAISTNAKNDDMQHPVHVSGLTLNDVDSTSKVFYHNPNLGKINPSDCVDMDCDALKKAMIKDTDGSLLGSPGFVLPNSAFEWNGDPARGLGDYRIPKVLLTEPDGSRIPVSTKCPHKGIFNTGNCTWVTEWNAFHCDDAVHYAMLSIESMDHDTETRRLSPVAVFSGGYVDLINGPQDHGWCSGYTCRKRLSTFPAIVPLDRWVDLYMTSTVPQHMRFILLNVAPTDCVGLSIWKAQPHRLDVYVDGQYVMPINGYMSAGRFFVRPEDYPDQYMPSLANKTMGDNYLRFYENTLYWVQCGPGIMEFKTAEVLIISFGLPAVTNEEFFGEQIVNNLAQFLSVPVEKVRVVNVVRETGTSGRRKRQTGTTYFYIEVGDSATDNSSSVDLVTAADQIVTQVQLYGMDDIINATVLYTSILEPSAGSSATFSTLKKVGSLMLTSHPVGGKEGQPFVVQPQLQVQDSNGDVVDYLGAYDSPWKVEVSIKSGGNGLATLIGNTTITFINGTADFSGLGMDRMGTYVLDFNITEPQQASNYSLQSMTVTVLGRGVSAEGELLSSSRIINAPLQLSFHLVDTDTGGNITDIAWRGHTWTVTASISDPDIYWGSLSGTTSASFDPVTGKADFLDLQLTRSGVCPVLFTIQSTPPDYTLTTEIYVHVMTIQQRDLVVEETSTIELKFPITYNATTAPYHAALVRNYFSELSDIVIRSHSYRQGSLVVTLVVEGTTSGVNSTVYAMCDNISNGTTFTFSGTTVSMSTYMTVNGQSFYGVSCGPIVDDDGLEPGVIAAIVIMIVVVVVVATAVVLWYCKVYPKTKTTDAHHVNAQYLGHRSDTVEDILFRENTFMSLKSHSSPMPPVTTTLGVLKDLLPPMPGTPELPRAPRSVTPTPRTVSPMPANEKAETPSLQDNSW